MICNHGIHTRSQEFESLVKIVILDIGKNVDRLGPDLLICAQDDNQKPTGEFLQYKPANGSH